jgi:hypothetical protein
MRRSCSSGSMHEADDPIFVADPAQGRDFAIDV